MEHIDTFINAKHGRSAIAYPHPSLKELLDETYGVIVYQDQVLLILQSFAGYTLGEADTVRKAMGKKIASMMAQERQRFIDGAQRKGFAQDVSVQVFDLIEPFAGYAFNKAHSVSYALISYWTAYFKAHYPVEYMASVLNSRLDHTDKIINAINECSKLKIPVLLPDINRSGEFFTIDKEAGPVPSLRFGLAAIKTIGEGAVRPLVEGRIKGGLFESIDDFCHRADVSALNRRTLESLVKAGVFDSLGPRGAVLNAVDQIISAAQLETRMRNTGQTSMFDAIGRKDSGSIVPGIDLKGMEVSREQKASWEREFLGVPLSYNPLLELANIDAGDAIASLDQLDEELQGQSLVLVGHVSGISERYTRDQKKFLIVSVDLLGGPMEVIVWPDVLERTAETWEEGKLVKAEGKLRVRGDQFSLACEEVEEFLPSAPAETNVASSYTRGSTYAPSNFPSNSNGNGNGTGNGIRKKSAPIAAVPAIVRSVVLDIEESDNPIEDAHLLREVIQVLLEYPGKDRVNLQIHTSTRRVLMELPVVSTGYCTELKERLEELLGADSVALQQLESSPQLEQAPF
jgi:DNA polymerase-3 subunit alpha